MERYRRLFSLGDNLYQTNSPIIVEAGVLLLDIKLEQVVAQLKFCNISDKTIKAVQMDIENYDIGGQQLESVEGFQYLDLAVTKGNVFGSRIPVKIPEKQTRSFRLGRVIVFFEEGEKWESADVWEELPEKEIVVGEDNFCQQYRIEFGDSARYRYKEVKDLWQCVCGAYNNVFDMECSVCCQKKDRLVQVTDDVINHQLASRLEKEEIERRQKEERELLRRKEQEENNKCLAKKRKKQVLVGVITCFGLVLVFVGFFFLNKRISERKMVLAANNLVLQNKYGEAIDLIDSSKYQNLSINQMREQYIDEGFNYFLKTDLKQAKEWHSSYEESFDDSNLLHNAQELFDEQKYEEAFALYSVLEGNNAVGMDYYLIKYANEYRDERITSEMSSDDIKQWLYNSAVETFKNNPREQSLEKVFSYLGNYDKCKVYKAIWEYAMAGDDIGFCEKIIVMSEPEIVRGICTKKLMKKIMSTCYEGKTGDCFAIINHSKDSNLFGNNPDTIWFYFDETQRLKYIEISYNTDNLSKKQLKALMKKLKIKEKNKGKSWYEKIISGKRFEIRYYNEENYKSMSLEVTF